MCVYTWKRDKQTKPKHHPLKKANKEVGKLREEKEKKEKNNLAFGERL